MRERLYEENKKNWEEFEKDVNNLLDNYHELLGLLKIIKIGELGKVNQVLNGLRNKTKEFLEKYDGDGNGTVDISELVEKRNELGADLRKEGPEEGGSKLGDIVQIIKDLEKEVINYRQGSSKKESKETNQQLENQTINEEQLMNQREEIM